MGSGGGGCTMKVVAGGNVMTGEGAVVAWQVRLEVEGEL